MKTDSLKTFCEALKQQDNFFMASHVNPEGDAIGSLIAIDSLLRRLGKKTLIICEDAFPERLSCLPHQDRWNVFDRIDGKNLKFKCLVVTDCPTLERIGKVKESVGPDTVVFNIDHHISNLGFGHHNLVVPGAAASGQVVYEIFK